MTAEWAGILIAAIAAAAGLSAWLMRVGGGIARIEATLSAVVAEQAHAKAGRRELHGKVAELDGWRALHEQRHTFHRTGEVDP